MLAFTSTTFFGASAATPSRIRTSTASRPKHIHVSMSAKVLIVNTKGGGHGHIGLHLARALLEKGSNVDILQMGDKTDNGPVAKYPELTEQYNSQFSVRFGNVSDDTVGTGYTAVYDNNAKSLEDIAPVINAGKAGAEVFYVSSAGAYSYNNNLAPHLVGDPAKGPTIDVENALRESGVSSVSFRPTYIIGEGSSKREYTDYFLDRIVRGRPVLLPGTGSELTALTDVRDIASMLAAAVGKGLKNEILNLVNTRCITFNGIVQLCADVCGKKAEAVYYDPKEIADQIDGFQVKKAFPFRPRHFFADPGESQMKLGWEPHFSGSLKGLSSTLKVCYDEYVALGLDKAHVDFSLDDQILACVRK